ncbi:MAG: hypothetical protein NTW52_04720 [Planctomycetota bacterium]|nr:hypothetical protein [Planctomycetota bacterium]
MLRSDGLVVILTLLVVISGCSSGESDYPVAVVTGKVLCDNKPVANALVYFQPMKPPSAAKDSSSLLGKMGIGLTAEDGTYKISTYGEADGAVLGMHRIRVLRPENPNFKCSCEINPTKTLLEVTVSEGQKNEFDIQLPPGTGAAQPQVDPDE